MIRTLLINLLLFCGFGITLAQQISIVPNSLFISVNNGLFTPSDTIRTNDSIVFRATYSNPGTIDITSPIDLIIQRGQDSTVRDTLFDQTPLDTLLAGGIDTLTRNYSDLVEPGQALYAPNGGGAIVVVVWPSVRNNPNVPVVDSSSINLTRDFPAALPLAENDQLRLYPNPASRILKLDWGMHKNKVDCVRIVNIVGQVKLLYEKELEVLDLTTLNQGQYWVQARLTDGRLILKAFVKE